MGFVIRSVFWLGLVYSAMPMEPGGLATAVPANGSPACATVATVAALAGRALGDPEPSTRAAAPALRAAAEAALATPASLAAARTARAKAPQSADTLSPDDRRARWRGAAAKSAG